jgi:hypothetical protein
VTPMAPRTHYVFFDTESRRDRGLSDAGRRVLGN